jgi:phosphotransferase system enzyme I (PtsI)
VLGLEDFRIPKQSVSVDAVEAEVERFRGALQNVCNEISANQKLDKEHLGEEHAAIFGAHLLLVRDPKLSKEIEDYIRDLHYSPEHATSLVLRRYARDLQNLGNKYLAERADDIFDLERALLRSLLGEQREELSHLTLPVIVLAHNLTAAETAGLNRNFVRAFVTEVGGSTSHTAILAGALEIPAIVGVGRFLTDVSGGETVIVDGDSGTLIVDPDKATLRKYEATEARRRSKAQRLRLQVEGPARTRCGVDISIYGNIEFPEEAEPCHNRGADGIGLYRTEFLYLGSTRERNEEDHYAAYKRVAETFPDRPVVIRTLDVGADKIPGAMRHVFDEVPNRELGLRSIRISLEYVSLFKTQLRAILRSAVHGDVRVMFPLISSLGELRQAKMIFRDVCEDLEEQGIPFRRDLPIGMMVEVPSAALLADEFAREVDFFSIGTNDLIQYTLAADRADPNVAKYYNPADPAVQILIRKVVEAGERAGIPVSVCGQMGSDPKFVPLLVGMGIRQLSVTPQSIPEIKDVIRNLTIEQAETIAEHCSHFELARDAEAYLRGELKKITPEQEVAVAS